MSTRRPLSKGLRRLIGERIDAFEGVWSRFRPDSLVSRAAAGALPSDDDGAVVLDLPDGSGRLLDLYDALHRATGGRLDPLVGADLVELGYDPRYSFVGAPAGSKVYVIPQTEAKGVIWPGWNTQDPQLVSKLNRGVNLTLEQVSGPGTFSLYLENGNFSAPQVLWSSTKNEPQKLWVEKNTHTHANWVFTAPGEYLLKVTASAELSDGSTVSDTRYLKFAVGDSASADALYAMEAQARGSASSGSASSASQAAGTQAAGTQASGSSSAAASTNQSGHQAEFTVPWGAIAAGVAAVIAVGAFLSFRRRSSAQREALDEVRGDRS